MTPLTSQEEKVKEMLTSLKMGFEPHHVFEIPGPLPCQGLSVDFLVFLGGGLVLECTSCHRKRGSALSELRRRAAFMDYRF
jgi:hypothetical protein